VGPRERGERGCDLLRRHFVGAVTRCIQGYCAVSVVSSGFWSARVRLVHQVHLSGVSGENKVKKAAGDKGDKRWTQKKQTAAQG